MADAIKIINVKILSDGNAIMETTKLGMQNEKNVTKLVFDIPEELNNYNKTIEFSFGEQSVTDIVTNNEYLIDNNISCNLFIIFQVIFTDEEGKEVFKTFLNECIFQPSINAVNPAPTPEEVSEWNGLVTALNQKIQEVEDLKDEIGGISEELDPTVPQYIKEITTEDITNWNNKSEFDGDYNKLINTPNIPNVPTKVSELENDKNYLTAIPNEYVTDAELTEKGYATEKYVTDKIAEIETSGGDIDTSNLATKEELANKVDKVTGKSLIADSEITRLASVKNYDDTELRNQINSKASISYVDEIVGDIETLLGGI